MIGEPFAFAADQLTMTLVLVALTGFTSGMPTLEGTLAASTDLTSEKDDHPCSF